MNNIEITNKEKEDAVRKEVITFLTRVFSKLEAKDEKFIQNTIAKWPDIKNRDVVGGC